GSIILLAPTGNSDEHSQVVKTLIRKGDTGEVKLDHYLNNLLAGWVSQHQKPLLSNDLIQAFGEANLKKNHRDIVSVLSVPLALHGKILGVINLIVLAGEQPFGERELHLMQILASQCAQFIVHARLHEELFAETNRLRKEVQNKYAFHGIIGHSPKMQEMFALLERIIPTEGRVLMEGESGTGKERIARVIHYSGPRKEGPFVAVDCGALPANLLESELFGYVKGAFTGAIRDKKGLFEAANGGTLFLDEIVNMPLEIQSKFLRAIQEGEIRPLGSTQVRKVDVRIIAAASGNLRAEVAAGRFRQDLFYRLNVVSISLPPLRERKEDIAILANHFLNKMATKYGKKITGFKPETLVHLEAYSWPGNVRELEHVVERMVILAEQNIEYISSELLPLELRLQASAAIHSPAQEPSPPDMKAIQDTHEKTMLLEA
ncbi:MAG: sigma-54 interaction domain-containing protein, partial [bacterium]